MTGSNHAGPLAAVLAFAASQGALAAHPLLTEDAFTQGKGGWQLEVNGERQRDPRPPDLPPLRAIESGTTLTYGLTHTIDLSFDLPYVRHEGVLDAAIGIKWRFHDGSPLSFALLGGAFLPTGDEQKGLGTGRYNAGALGIASWQGERWEFHSSAGARSNSNVIGQRGWLGHFSAAAGYRLLPPLRVLLDVAWDSNPQAEEGSLRNVVAGLIWTVNEYLELDAGFRKGNDPAVEKAFLFGVTLRW